MEAMRSNGPQDWEPEDLSWLLPAVPLTECGKVTKAYTSLSDTGLLLSQSLASGHLYGFALAISECLITYPSIVTLSQGKICIVVWWLFHSIPTSPFSLTQAFHLIAYIFAHLIPSWDQLLREFKVMQWPRTFWISEVFLIIFQYQHCQMWNWF